MIITINNLIHISYCNKRPIIGILTQELDNNVLDSFENSNYTSYIRASYVNFVESAGARVAPVLINQSDEYYNTIFRGTNRLLIPGGHVKSIDSGWTAFVKIYK